MPLSNEVIGTNEDGTPNEDYCIYCYKDGKFVQDMTMEQMIDHCAQFTDEINKNSGQNLTVEQMKEQMRQFFPHLKRWKNWFGYSTAVDTIIAKDPFNINGIADYQIVEFTPTMLCESTFPYMLKWAT